MRLNELVQHLRMEWNYEALAKHAHNENDFFLQTKISHPPFPHRTTHGTCNSWHPFFKR